MVSHPRVKNDMGGKVLNSFPFIRLLLLLLGEILQMLSVSLNYSFWQWSVHKTVNAVLSSFLDLDQLSWVTSQQYGIGSCLIELQVM